MSVEIKSGQRITFEPRLKVLSQAVKNATNDHDLANALVAMSRFRISSGQLVDAKSAIERAYALDPQNPNVLHHYGLSQMRYDGILAGIQNYDRGRWGIPAHVEKYYRAFDFPYWEGQNLEGKKILIWAEQGIGDQVMHARSIPYLQAMGASVSLECDPRLNPLFSRNFNNVTYFRQGLKPDTKINKIDFDYHCSLFSVWRWTKPAPFPKQFLSADTDRVAFHRKAMLARGYKFNIGLSWSSAAKANGSTRSIPLDQLRPLLDTPNVAFHSLQYGISTTELVQLRHSEKLPINTIPNLDARNNIDDLLAAIQAMDMVISIDNSTVHFSGALGVKTWVILPKSSEWRWGHASQKSPLYDSISLYRNETAGQWQPTLEAITSDLRVFNKKDEQLQEKHINQTKAKKIAPAGRNFVIDPIDSLPVRRFMKLHKAKDYAAAQLMETELSERDLTRPNIIFCRSVIRQHFGHIDKAKALLESILVNSPNHVGAVHNLGTICLDKMEYDKGEKYFRRSIELDPKNANAYNNLGACCSYQGRPKEAKEFYLKALELDPTRAQTFRNMCQHHKFKTYDDVLVTLLVALSDENLSDDDRSHLCFSAFKAFDDLGERKRAFEYLAKGNKLCRDVFKYTPKSDTDNLTIIKRAFGKPIVSLNAKFIKNNPLPHTPIFIIGMPRSGTSLTEQVLSAHSQVHGGGELPTLNQIANPLLAKLYGKVTNTELTPAHFEHFRRQYIHACKDVPHDCAYLTDKMPANFRWVGFIKNALPEAKIINQIRDPRAICWSIFKLRFSSVGNGYAYNQTDLGNYYNRYKDLMTHWDAQYPNQIHNLNYEHFTENQLQDTQDLLNHIGLPWEDACIDFHNSKRPVKTASSSQVTKKLYTGSSQAWRKYEHYLGPLLDALGPIN